MKIENIGDIQKLEYFLKQAFGEIPDNLIIVSEPIVNEAVGWIGKTLEVTKEPSGVKILGIPVMKEVAEIIK